MFRNIISNYVGRIWSVLAIFLFTPMYVNILGIEAYGLIAFYSIILTFSSVADAGLSVTFSREIAKNKEIGDWFAPLIATMERLLLASTATICILFSLLVPWIAANWLNDTINISERQIVISLILMAMTVPAQMLMSFYQAGLMGMQEQVKSNVLQSIFTLIKLGGIVPLISEPADIVFFFQWQCGVTILFSIVARYLVHRQARLPLFYLGKFDFASVKPLILFSASMMGVSAISSINSQIDRVMVSSLFSVGDFGQYALAASLAQIPMIIGMPIAAALSPRLTSLVSVCDNDTLELLFSRYSRLASLIAALAAGGLLFFPSQLLHLWLGHEASDTLPKLVALLGVGGLFYALQVPCYYLCLAEGKSRQILYVTVTALALTAPLIYLTTQIGGLMAVPWSWMLLNFIGLIFLSRTALQRFDKRYTVVWVVRDIMLPVFSGYALLWALSLFARLNALDTVQVCAIAGFVSASAILLYWKLWPLNVSVKLDQ
jgi:O-antigen/teichoic acid export membrane protein